MLQAYGVWVKFSESVRQLLIGDAKGDALDVMPCAVQAAAFELASCKHTSIPATADPVEGWIVDPTYIAGD